MKYKEEHKASWERYAKQLTFPLEYGGGGETTPEYWSVFIKCPDLSTLIFGHIEERRALARVSFKALLHIQSGNVQYAGFQGAQLGYLGGQVGDPPPFDWGANFPATTTFQPTVDSIEYDPAPLPIGGVTFPVWQRKSTDWLTADHYIANAENPSGLSLLGEAYVQIQASTLTNPAVACEVLMKYEILEQEG